MPHTHVTLDHADGGHIGVLTGIDFLPREGEHVYFEATRYVVLSVSHAPLDSTVHLTVEEDEP